MAKAAKSDNTGWWIAGGTALVAGGLWLASRYVTSGGKLRADVVRFDWPSRLWLRLRNIGGATLKVEAIFGDVKVAGVKIAQINYAGPTVAVKKASMAEVPLKLLVEWFAIVAALPGIDLKNPTVDVSLDVRANGLVIPISQSVPVPGLDKLLKKKKGGEDEG